VKSLFSKDLNEINIGFASAVRQSALNEDQIVMSSKQYKLKEVVFIP
jgi:hypothetical protein